MSCKAVTICDRLKIIQSWSVNWFLHDPYSVYICQDNTANICIRERIHCPLTIGSEITKGFKQSMITSTEMGILNVNYKCFPDIGDFIKHFGIYHTMVWYCDMQWTLTPIISPMAPFRLWKKIKCWSLKYYLVKAHLGQDWAVVIQNAHFASKFACYHLTVYNMLVYCSSCLCEFRFCFNSAGLMGTHRLLQIWQIQKQPENVLFSKKHNI